MAKELSKVGIVTGNDIKAPHVTQSVDAFTGLDAYDITISGSLEVTGSISTNSTVYANALNLEGGNIEYFPSTNFLKLGDNIKLGIGVGAISVPDIQIFSDGTEGYIQSTISNLTFQSTNGNTIIRNTKSGKNILLQPDATGGGSSVGVLISGSSPNCRLDVRGPITGSSNISASGDIFGDDITAADRVNCQVISASNHVLAKEIKVTNNAGIKLGYHDTVFNNEATDITLQTDNDGEIHLVKNNVGVMLINSSNNIVFGGGYNITASANISASGNIYGSTIVATDNVIVRHQSTDIDDKNLIVEDNQLRNQFEVSNHDGIPTLKLNHSGSPTDPTSPTGSLTFDIRKQTFTYMQDKGIVIPIPATDIRKTGIGMIRLSDEAPLLRTTLDRGFSNVNSSTSKGFGAYFIESFNTNVYSQEPEFRFHMSDNPLPVLYSGGAFDGGGFVNRSGLRIQHNLVVNNEAFKTTISFSTTSDERLKENIVTASLDTCYDTLKSIPLKYFKWKEGVQEDPVNDRNSLGWIAQDVAKVFPKAIFKANFTTYSTYTGSIAITGSDGKSTLQPGRRYQDILAGSEFIEDRHFLQSDQITKMMYGAIQKLQEKVEALELQISGSNS